MTLVIRVCYDGGLYTRMGHCVVAANVSSWEPRWPRSGQLRIGEMTDFVQMIWRQEEGQDVAQYAVMLAVILVIAGGTIRLIGSHAGNIFASVSRSIQ